MTKEEMIEMAREALKQEPREDWNSTAWVFADETLQAFARLVARHERETCAKMCEEYFERVMASRIRTRGNYD